MSNKTRSIASVAADRGLIGGPFGSDLVGADYVSEGIPVIRGANMGSKYVHGEYVFVTPEKFEKSLKRNSALPGDVIFTQRGTLGQVSIIPNNDYPEYVVSQSQMRLRIAPGFSNEFIYYACLTNDFNKQILDHAISTGVPHTNLGILSKLTIPDIPLPDQKAIAEVLGALDDKIAANDGAIRLIAELKDAEFRQLIAGSTDSLLFSDVATILKGYSYRSDELASPSKSALVTLKCISRDGLFAPRGLKAFQGKPKNHQYVKADDIVIAQTDLTQAADVIGTAVRIPDGLSYENLVASLDLLIIRANPSVPQLYLLGALRTEQFRNFCKTHVNGTTVLHLASKALNSYSIPLAPIDKMIAYAENARHRFGLVDALTSESTRLAVTRDELLPLLMSGKLRVKDIEEVL